MAQLEAEEDDGLELPTKQNDEFRPFIRRLPEFKFWYSATKATFIGENLCNFTEFLSSNMHFILREFFLERFFFREIVSLPIGK